MLGAIVRLVRFARAASLRPQIPRKIVQVNTGGFGDRQNCYAWSMAWFKGKLYVGTARNLLCVERATLDFYVPEWNLYSTPPIRADIPCPSNPYDLDLRAEIWRYTPETTAWERVYRSPDDLPNPKAPSKFVARDIGFREMVVFPEPDGTEALYVAGVTAREHIPGLPPPRILRSTDGETFKPIPQEPGTFLGDLDAVGFRAMAVHRGRLYVTASTSLLGDGMILEATSPAEGNDHFRQVSLPDLKAFELAVFNDFLYVGAGDATRGYSVWKTDATGTPPYRFLPVVTDGAGRERQVVSVVSMHPFQGRLYVGSNGWYPQQILRSELIRINPDDTWELVVGRRRQTSQGEKIPISGLMDGFGNPFNVHFWRMQEHEEALYLGTNDASWGLDMLPRLDRLIRAEYGFDLWMSVNGKDWGQITANGFGDKFNFGARTFASTPFGLFLGSANHVSGTEVWLITAP